MVPAAMLKPVESKAVTPVAETLAAAPIVAAVAAVPKPAPPVEPKPTAAMALEKSVPAKPSARRFHLRLDAPIVDAPSIGPKTATRFHQLGLKTISDLLDADADDMARKMSTRHITADVLRDWQAQSLLMVDVPGLRGHDAQLLVAAEVRDRTALRTADAESLLERVLDIARTSHGRSILRDSTPPDLEEVENWIAAAVDANTGSGSDEQESGSDRAKTTVLS